MKFTTIFHNGNERITYELVNIRPASIANLMPDLWFRHQVRHQVSFLILLPHISDCYVMRGDFCGDLVERS